MINIELLREMKGTEKHIIVNVLWQWVSLIFQIIAMISLSILLGSLFLKDVVVENAITAIVIIALSAVMKLVCDRLSAKSAYLASYSVKKSLRKSIYEKLIQIGSGYRDRVTTAELMQFTVEGVEQLEIYYGRYLPQFFYSIMAPITLFSVISFMNLKIALILILCVPLIPLSIVIVQKIAKRLLRKYWGIYTGLGDTFLENIQGLTTLKIYESDGYKADKMDEEAENFRKVTMKVLSMQLNSISVMDFFSYGGAAAGAVMAVSSYMNGILQLWQTIAIILLASEFFIPIRLFGSFFHIAMNGIAASEKIFEFLKSEVGEKKTCELKDEDIRISIENLHFSYDDERAVLKDVNMNIESGKMTALVGISGSGKSTVASLIMGKYTKYNGSININNTDLRCIDESSVFENITYVKFNSYIFGGSVYDNLIMAKEDATVSDMIEVLKKVQLWDFLQGERGVDTIINQQASNLSGGQKQRLAIARALLRDSKAYIFDEASSNIDVESEEIIMNIIKELSKSKTVLLITHRMANVVDAHVIYVMENGQITEKGNHLELMKGEKTYSQLYKKQDELCRKWGDCHEA